MLLDQFGSLFEFLADHPQYHAKKTSFYRFLEELTLQAFLEVKSAFESGKEVPFSALGSINLPYEQMGAINSIDLFGLDELLMFSFYFRNRHRYKCAVDIGANIGLHSIVLCKCGIKVVAYEPDPSHFGKLLLNLELNNITSCEPRQAAVSDIDGTMQFVRVLGNTTSSHLAGAKSNPYGELEIFDVAVEDIVGIANRADLLKIDAEGHEVTIINRMSIEAWRRVDAFLEIGTYKNACLVFERFSDTDVNIFSQKSGWARVETIDNMPHSYKDGGVFVSVKTVMPW